MVDGAYCKDRCLFPARKNSLTRIVCRLPPAVPSAAPAPPAEQVGQSRHGLRSARHVAKENAGGAPTCAGRPGFLVARRRRRRGGRGNRALGPQPISSTQFTPAALAAG